MKEPGQKEPESPEIFPRPWHTRKSPLATWSYLLDNSGITFEGERELWENIKKHTVSLHSTLHFPHHEGQCLSHPQLQSLTCSYSLHLYFLPKVFNIYLKPKFMLAASGEYGVAQNKMLSYSSHTRGCGREMTLLDESVGSVFRLTAHNSFFYSLDTYMNFLFFKMMHLESTF